MINWTLSGLDIRFITAKFVCVSINSITSISVLVGIMNEWVCQRMKVTKILILGPKVILKG